MIRCQTKTTSTDPQGDDPLKPAAAARNTVRACTYESLLWCLGCGYSVTMLQPTSSPPAACLCLNRGFHAWYKTCNFKHGAAEWPKTCSRVSNIGPVWTLGQVMSLPCHFWESKDGDSRHKQEVLRKTSGGLIWSHRTGALKLKLIIWRSRVHSGTEANWG